jgi:hypothetical protein
MGGWVDGDGHKQFTPFFFTISSISWLAFIIGYSFDYGEEGS